MCTYNITVDEQAIARMSPSVTKETFGPLLQRFVDDFVDLLVCNQAPSPCSYTEEELYEILEERIRRVEAGQEEVIPNNVVFDSTRSKYGF